LNLPFITSKEKFLSVVEELMDSEDITEKQQEYLKTKLKTKQTWAKCFLKETFVGGVSTTSRVEGLHALQRRYLTSNSNLQNLFYSFRSIEKTQLIKYEQEFRKWTKALTAQKINLLEKIKTDFPEYVYKKIYPKFCKALNYKHQMLSSTSW